MTAKAPMRSARRRGEPRKETRARAWKWSPAREDTAPDGTPPTPDPTSWGSSPEESRALLLDRTCPICGRGPWSSVLNHVSRLHGIDRATMRDVCLLTTKEKLTSEEARAAYAENGRDRFADLGGSLTGGDRKPARVTAAAKVARQAGRDRLAALADSGEMASVWAANGDRLRAAMSDEETKQAMLAAAHSSRRPMTDAERAAFAERMQSPEVEAKRAARRDQARTVGCRVDGCGNPHTARGFCRMHWGRWKETGDPGESATRRKTYAPICTVSGCDAKHYSKGKCRLHWEREWRSARG